MCHKTVTWSRWDMHDTQVIWITGYSASGKTTVGRKVVSLIREDGRAAALLDGDDLRSIFGDKWGYAREDRVELARVYFRLASHLAAQGVTVVVAAVAMYKDVREWVAEHIPGATQVYLSVPTEELIRRDEKTKRIYEKIGDLSELYDAPGDEVVVIEN